VFVVLNLFFIDLFVPFLLLLFPPVLSVVYRSHDC